MIKLQIPFGGASVEITGDNEREIIKQAAFWFDLPQECPLCKSPLVFGYRTPKTFTYYSLICTGPVRHEVNLGEKMVTHDLYFDSKKTWGVYNFQDRQNDNAGNDVARSSNDAGNSVAAPKVAPSAPAPNKFPVLPDTPARVAMFARIHDLDGLLTAASFVTGVRLGELNQKTDEQLTNIGKMLLQKCETAGLPTNAN